ncbi:hypothetical protein P3S68_029744 [Capsicum galapagoense]
MLLNTHGRVLLNQLTYWASDEFKNKSHIQVYRWFQAIEIDLEPNSWEIFKKLHKKRMTVLLMPSRRALI